MKEYIVRKIKYKRKDKLNSLVNTWQSSRAQCFRMIPCIPSGPGAFRVLTRRKFSSTSSSLIKISSCESSMFDNKLLIEFEKS